MYKYSKPKIFNADLQKLSTVNQNESETCGHSATYDHQIMADGFDHFYVQSKLFWGLAAQNRERTEV